MTINRRIRHALLASAAIVSLGAGAALAQNAAISTPEQPLAQSLKDIARQTGENILFTPDAVAGLNAHALSGQMSAADAVNALIAGTGLEAVSDGSGGLVIQKARPKNAEAAHDERAANSADNSIEEVVVTAEKRPEAVRQISGSVTAFTGANLEQIGANSLEDYLTFAPGVVFNAAIPGESSVSIRGVSTTTDFDQGQAPTGYFINDVPLTDPYFTVSVPDIDAFDVDNVTVLRGPQGTLFGSASLGGAIDYQAAKPDLDEYQVHLQSTAEATDGGGTGGSGKLMVNLPVISDTLAVRGVYIYRDDPGFIDNIGIDRKNSNDTLTRGGRIEVAWNPASGTRINYLFLDQSEDNADLGYQEPYYAGTLKKDTLIPESADYKTLIHNLRLDQDLGFATLTATATYHEKTQYSDEDLTAYFGAFLPGVSPITAPQTAYSKGYTFEMRVASPSGQRFEYLVGVMHDHTAENFDDHFEGANAAQVIETLYSGIFGAGIGQKSAPGGVFYYDLLPFRGDETAAFGEATYHFDDQWKVTLGGRLFETASNNESIVGGFFDLLTSGQLSSTLIGKQSENGFTPKGSITWTPNEDIMAYFLVSKGFRFGGPNISPSGPGFPIPPTFGSDSLINYELGTRTNWFGGRLQLDATVFYIDWSNIQLRLATPTGLAYAANAGKANNYGFEGTATWLIEPGLNLQTNLTYLEATLGQSFSPETGATIPAGSTLPGAAKWQVSEVLSYQWADAPFKPSFLLTDRFISKAPGSYLGGIPQDGYSQLDARVVFHVNAFDANDVDVTAFVTNIADSHGVTNGLYEPGETQYEQYIIRPRTIGITLDYKMN